jgi:hypothetical protein
MRRLSTWFLGLAFGLTQVASADVVTDWNNQLCESVRAERTNPPRACRFMAMVQVAVYDAVNGVLGGFEPYYVEGQALGADPSAAAAAAAHRVLVNIYPTRASIFDAALAASLAGIPDGQAKDFGVAWGEYCADQILALRANDNSDLVVPYTVSGEIGRWEPTPPAFTPSPLLPNWPLVTPWAMARGSQFRSPPPPALTSQEYTEAYNEVKEVGRVDSTTRTPDQSEIALFWADGAGTATPPGHWNLIAQGISAQEGLSLQENARLFALIGIAVADSAIVSWDNKYFYDHWRPVSGIRKGDLDGNPNTEADPTWSSFVVTPPFSSFTSGHSTFSSSSSKILEQFFGTDDIAFTTGPDVGVAVAPRSFSSFSSAADEAGQSRIYGGIHWQYDNYRALFGGRSLSRLVFNNYLRPVGDLSLRLNQTLFDSGGGTMVLRARLEPAQPGQQVDAYVALQTPGDALFFLQADGTLSSDPLPLAENVETGSFDAPIFSIGLSGAEDIPVGTYIWKAALTEHGKLQLASNIATVAFNINPFSE